MKTLEARLQLRTNRKRAPDVRVDSVNPPPQGLDVELPSDITKRIRSFENTKSSFVVGTGPRGSVDALSAALDTRVKRENWCAQARIAAILGSCSLSLPSVRSGCRCYFAFAERVLEKSQAQALPPSVDELLAWSCTFRCAETFSNYLSYLKVGTMLLGANTEVFQDNVLARAKKAIMKRGGFKRRERMFLQLDIVRQLLLACGGHAVELKWGMLYLLAYVFMLRLPSEALPVVRGCIGLANNSEYSSMVYIDGEHLCLKLKRRKNKAGGSLMKRACWCGQCQVTCPVHVLWPFFAKLELGKMAFAGVYAGSALKQLRAMLQVLGIENFGQYRCHDLRRGHAKDMQLRGASLYEILAAGEWKSPAFLDYLSLMDLEMGAVIEAHQAESSSEDGE